MNIPFAPLALPWHIVAAVIYFALLAWVIRIAPWATLRDSTQQHVYLGVCVLLMVLWLIKTPILPGLEYHYLGATLLTLMFGWPLAFIAMSVVIAGAVINGSIDWMSYPLNVLVMGAAPIAVAHTVWRTTERYLPPNFFIFIFVTAYWGAALASAVAVLTGATVLGLAGVYTVTQLTDKYLPLLLLLVVPEGFITGTLITMMVVFRPEWVAGFDDKRYIKGR